MPSVGDTTSQPSLDSLGIDPGDFRDLVDVHLRVAHRSTQAFVGHPGRSHRLEYGYQCLACEVMWPVLTYPQTATPSTDRARSHR